MADVLLEEQIAYYRRRADEYDATAYGDVMEARERIDRIVSALPPAARGLELACGTGMWTQSLANRTTELTAVDAAPEGLAIARARCPSGVEFVRADVLDWLPAGQFDLIFLRVLAVPRPVQSARRALQASRASGGAYRSGGLRR